MSSKDFIQSGLLELYALGLCSDTEREQVEQALATDEQVRREYDAICTALDHLASEQSTPPPSDLKDRIMGALEEKEEQEEEHPEVREPAKPRQENTLKAADSPAPSRVTSIQSSNRRTYRWLAAASVVLLAGSLALNYVLYERMNKAEEEVAFLRNNNMLLSDENGIIKSRYEVLQEQYAFLADRNMKALNLAGTENYPEPEAVLFWNKEKGDVILVTSSLPELKQNEQYQLWAIDGGVPKNAGLVPEDFVNGGAYKLKNIGSSEAFAITIERKGGSAVPTLDKMVVFGKL